MFRFDLHQLVNLYWVLCESRNSFYNTETILQCDEEVKALIQGRFEIEDVESKVIHFAPIISSEISLKFGQK